MGIVRQLTNALRSCWLLWSKYSSCVRETWPCNERLGFLFFSIAEVSTICCRIASTKCCSKNVFEMQYLTVCRIWFLPNIPALCVGSRCWCQRRPHACLNRKYRRPVSTYCWTLPRKWLNAPISTRLCYAQGMSRMSLSGQLLEQIFCFFIKIRKFEISDLVCTVSRSSRICLMRSYRWLPSTMRRRTHFLRS